MQRFRKRSDTHNRAWCEQGQQQCVFCQVLSLLIFPEELREILHFCLSPV